MATLPVTQRIGFGAMRWACRPRGGTAATILTGHGHTLAQHQPLPWHAPAVQSAYPPACTALLIMLHACLQCTALPSEPPDTHAA